jgi:hypothetical protein
MILNKSLKQDEFSKDMYNICRQLEEKDVALASKDVALASKDDALASKDVALASKDTILTFMRDKLADANLRYLVALGNISIRGVLESMEKDSVYLETKEYLRKYRTQEDKHTVSRRVVWEAILKDPEKSSRFPNLKRLEIDKINVVDNIVSIHSSSSKGIHNATFKEVLIDLDSFSRNEVSSSYN